MGSGPDALGTEMHDPLTHEQWALEEEDAVPHRVSEGCWYL